MVQGKAHIIDRATNNEHQLYPAPYLGNAESKFTDTEIGYLRKYHWIMVLYQHE